MQWATGNGCMFVGCFAVRNRMCVSAERRSNTHNRTQMAIKSIRSMKRISSDDSSSSSSSIARAGIPLNCLRIFYYCYFCSYRVDGDGDLNMTRRALIHVSFCPLPCVCERRYILQSSILHNNNNNNASISFHPLPYR